MGLSCGPTPSLDALVFVRGEVAPTQTFDVYPLSKNTDKELYARKLAEIKKKAYSINLGLQKLEQGAADVEKMKIVLAKEEVKLQEAERACTAMLSSLEISSLEAKKEKEIVDKIKTACVEEATKIKAEKDACQEDLAKAQPFLDEADRAVNSIKPADLNEMKKLPKPGAVIKLTFDCVAILRMFPICKVENVSITMGIGKAKRTFDFVKDSYSIVQKGMLADAGFLKALFHFSINEKDNMNDETIELMAPYLDLPEFTPAVAKNASRAAEGLCSWVRAMAMYHGASKIVKPKLEALKIAEAKLDQANKELAKAEEKLAKVKAKLDGLQKDFENQMAEKAAVEAGALATKKKMEQATSLINGLANERVRWTEDSAAFADRIKRLVGDCAVAAAFTSYCGPFNADFRNLLVNEHFRADLTSRDVPVSEDMELTDFLVDRGTVGDWNLQGLPTDNLSTQNGILVTKSSRFPLLVDPQGQAINWIMNKEADNLPTFGTTTLAHSRFRDQLDFSVPTART